MTRRVGQNPSLRIRKGANKTKYYYFQYWLDEPGQEGRTRKTEVIGLVSTMTKSEAERKKLEFISNLKINSSGYKIPSSRTFAHVVKHYQEVFAPRMLRESTLSVANYHISKHLLPDWKDTPIEHINIDSVNEWIWKKRQTGMKWFYIKKILQTMQRVLSCSSKDKKPPFSLEGLAIPERDKLQMKIKSREAISYSWDETMLMVSEIEKLNMDESKKKRAAMIFVLASASGLRGGELFALRLNDLDFKANTVRVDESVCPRTLRIGPCKNAAAYRTVVLADAEGKQAMMLLQEFLAARQANSNELLFPSPQNTALRAANVLKEALHPVLKALGLPKAGLHAFRHGCNRRWELSGMNPACQRQQMGHSSATMTALYTGEIPLAQVQAAFSKMNGNKIDVLENVENECLKRAVA
jgi:integrase